jgi:predicted secreted acid phosphatase
MERAMLWFKCAAVHDPVRPVVKKPAVIGWEAKQRQVDLVIERSFEGDELLSRMKGWVTADVNKVIEIVRQHGQLKTLDDYDLVVETRDKTDQETLSQKLSQAFGGEVWIEPIAKSVLS